MQMLQTSAVEPVCDNIGLTGSGNLASMGLVLHMEALMKIRNPVL